MSTLAKIINRNILRETAGDRFFERGKEYFSEGCVRGLAEHDGTITAKVAGTRDYRVKLWVEEGDLEYSCTCPVGADGEFCKHCVAVGLAWLNPEKERKASSKPAVTMNDARAALAAQPKEALVALLMEQAMEDDRLRQKLLLKAAKQSRKGINLNAYRNAIEEAVDTGRFVDYHEAYGYAQGIEEAVDSIEDLLKEGHAAEVIELAEHALKAVEDAIGSMDDSDGHMGGILERLQGMHRAACRKARPDPEVLAKRLFQWEMNAQYGTFYGALDTYSSVLGEKGLAVYRKLAEAEWASVPARAAGDKGGFSSYSRITDIMESIAERSGDIEALVAIKKRDLSSAYSYLKIAESYKAARKRDQALEWAEKGLKAFPHNTDSRLRQFLAEEYHGRKRHAEAMELIWAEFAERHGLENYKILKTHADRTKDWPQWRDKALAFAREHLAKGREAAKKDRWSWYAREGHSDLVRIFLWERKNEDAWREAKEGGCSEDLWIKLAGLREEAHPQDALAIYQARIEPALNLTNDEGYRRAVEFLRKVRGLMARLGRAEEFSRYLESTRTAFKRKRNFIKMLDRALPA